MTSSCQEPTFLSVTSDPREVASVVAWPTPVSSYEARSFPALAKCFRKSIRAFAAAPAPRTNLVRGIPANDTRGDLLRWHSLPPADVAAMKPAFAAQWSLVCQSTLESLQTALSTAPVCSLCVCPTRTRPLVLVADARHCPPAVGAVLLQGGRPVSLDSRQLQGAGLQQSASDIEMGLASPPCLTRVAL